MTEYLYRVWAFDPDGILEIEWEYDIGQRLSRPLTCSPTHVMGISTMGHELAVVTIRDCAAELQGTTVWAKAVCKGVLVPHVVQKLDRQKTQPISSVTSNGTICDFNDNPLDPTDFVYHDPDPCLPGDEFWAAATKGTGEVTVVMDVPNMRQISILDVYNPGDINLDYKVDFSDFARFSQSFPQDHSWAVDPLFHCVMDIGTTGGFNFYAHGVYEIAAKGSDIWGSYDEFRYVLTPVTGDFEISTQVLHLDNTDPWAKAGLMAREDVDPASPHAYMAVTPQAGEGRFAFQTRSIRGGLSNSLHSLQGKVRYPNNTWLKLERTGNIFTSRISDDGINWVVFPGTLASETDGPNSVNPVSINMSPTILVGLAVTSHSATTLCTGQFDNVVLNTNLP